jgi:hypothetical protein
VRVFYCFNRYRLKNLTAILKNAISFCPTIHLFSLSVLALARYLWSNNSALSSVTRWANKYGRKNLRLGT